MKKFYLMILVLLTSCVGSQRVQPTLTATESIVATETITQLPTETSTPQSFFVTADYGPDLEDFPASFNPLTGREVRDPSLLKLPAVLVSISNMPVDARPQAGPGFAPWVFEIGRAHV